MLKIASLVAAAAAFFLCASGRLVALEPAGSGSRPNIVLIIVDTLRADALAAYGRQSTVASEIDALAASGAVFESAIAQSSWTRSSIGSILTSQYPRALGIFKEKWDALPDSALTLAEALHAAGYFTAGATGNPHLNRSFGFAQGFDRYLDSHVIFPWMEEAADKTRMSRQAPIASGREVFGRLLEEVRSNPARPMYLQALIMDVHGHQRIPEREIDAALARQPNAAYLEGVRRASLAIGGFLEQLRRLPGFDNTLLVITADHGQGLDDHPAVKDSKRHGNLLYESHLHVPLVFHSFADPLWRGRRIAQDTALLDLMPTLLEAAGASVPELKGRSLLPLVNAPAEQKPLHEYIFAETSWRKVEKLAVLNRNWLYISNRDGQKGAPRDELQRRGTPQNGKLTDQSKKQKSITEELKKALAGWEAENPLHRDDSAESVSEPLPKEVNQLKTLGYL